MGYSRRLAAGALAALTAAGLLAAVPARAGQDSDHEAAPTGAYERNEPAIAVDPTNPQHVVTAANDYNYSDHGSLQHVAVYPSRDGGRSFHRAIELPTPAVSSGQAGSDPGLAFDSSGRLYASYLSMDYLAVARSDDAGWTWKSTPTVVAAPTACGHPDFPSIATTRTRIFVAWQQATTNSSCQQGHRLWLSSSRDGGMTWARPRALPTPAGSFALIPELAADAAGQIAVSYLSVPLQQPATNCPPNYAVDLVVDTSTNGRSFTVHNIVTSICAGTDLDTGAQSPATGRDMQLDPMGDLAGSGISQNPAIDPTTRTLMVAAAYATGHHVLTTHLFAWTNTGWAERTPPAPSPAQQQMPRFAVGTQGRSCLVWLQQLPGNLLSTWATTSRDDGRDWSRPTQVSSATFYGNGPGLTGNFIGDYIGAAVGTDGVAHPVWTDTRALPSSLNGPYEQIWTRRVAT